MIVYNKKNSCKSQISEDIKELEKYKNSYNKRIILYNIYLNTMDIFKSDSISKEGLNSQELNNKIQNFNAQVQKIDNNINILNGLLQSSDEQGKLTIEKKVINKYNQKYREIRNNYINNSLLEEDITTEYINGLINDFTTTFEKMKQSHKAEIENIISQNKVNAIQNAEYEKEPVEHAETLEEIEDDNKMNTNIENIVNENNELKNNNTLLISEKEGKVVLPYTAKEVKEILNSNDNQYQTAEEIIEKEFTRNFADYKSQFSSRYKETMKLARNKENYSLFESIALATEMMGKQLLHPAIISACRSLNDLDVYLDCLDKNELEDFKIFKIKYELYPMAVKNKDSYNLTNKNKKNYKNKDKSKSTHRGTRYKENTELRKWKKLKNIFNTKRIGKFDS